MRHLVSIATGLAVLLGLSMAAKASGPASAEGQETYTSLCLTCHGVYGRGDGPATQYLEIHPPDFTQPRFFEGRSDEEIVTGLLEKAKHPETAHSPMVLAGVVREEPLRAAVHYARSLGAPGRHASLPAGRDVYVAICWSCHGVAGDGKGPAAKNLAQKPRDFTSSEFRLAGREEEVYEIIALGAAKSFHGSEAMVAWKGALTEQQIRDVMAYIEMLKKKAAS